ncbi:MAG: aspartate aminotransferase family protein [Hyphomicrobiales bacterium]|nr:aspartate aminotransferase family protein [Hyphomicrobiales bacterium]
MQTTSLPQTGTPRERLIREMEDARGGDVDWRAGKLPGFYVHFARDDVVDIGKDAFNRFFSTNALGLGAFPSIAKFESELVGWVLDLFHAPETACGSVTSGGTESIFLAVKTARDHALAQRPDIAQPKIIVPYSAHPAFSKAAKYLRMTIERVPLTAGLRVDPAAVAAAIDNETIMLVGSAPEFTYGMIDPIDELAELASRHGLWMHVDACVGGFIAPFAERLGHDIPRWDFRVPGVTSISADLHKYGFAPKGASVVAFRDDAYRAFQIFDFDGWSRGRYLAPTFAGTRSGANIAAAWAVMKYLGMEGYLEIAGEIMAKMDMLRAGIDAIDGIEVCGDPRLSLMSFQSPGLDIHAIAAGLSERGWYTVAPSPDPPAINLGLLSLAFGAVAETWLEDLREIVAAVKDGKTDFDRDKVGSYGTG